MTVGCSWKAVMEISSDWKKKNASEYFENIKFIIFWDDTCLAGSKNSVQKY